MPAKSALSGTVVNTHDAKTNLSKYLARVAAGETIIIARAGKPVARLSPATVEPTPRKSVLGALQGRFTIDETVSRELDREIEDMFLGPDDRSS
jgi:prevent-host-death family protein